MLQSWSNETQSELHAIERTVNVLNSPVYFAVIRSRLSFNGVESGTHILLIDTYYKGRVLLTR